MRIQVELPDTLWTELAPVLSGKGIAIDELISGALAAYLLGERGDIMTPTGYLITADHIQEAMREMMAGGNPRVDPS